MRLSNRLAAASGVSGLPMAEGSLPGRCKPPFSWLPIGEQSGSSNITCVQEPPKPTEWIEVRRSEVCGHGTASSRIYEFVSYDSGQIESRTLIFREFWSIFLFGFR